MLYNNFLKSSHYLEDGFFHADRRESSQFQRVVYYAIITNTLYLVAYDVIILKFMHYSDVTICFLIAYCDTL